MRAAVAILALALSLAAEIIDRIAVILDSDVITESEILRQIRLTALLNGEQPQITPRTRRDTAERLIEQWLIRREMELNRLGVDARPAAEARYSEFRKRFAGEQSYLEVLRSHGLSDEDVREALLWQATLLEFIAVRFRPGVQVPEEEIRDYFEREIRPLAPTHPEARISYEEARPQIEAILINQRVDNALDRWLGQARTQTRILYNQEVLR